MIKIMDASWQSSRTAWRDNKWHDAPSCRRVFSLPPLSIPLCVHAYTKYLVASLLLYHAILNYKL